MSTFERYLTLWVGLCIVAGVLLGHLFPGLFQLVGSAEIASVNLPVAVLIWLMVVPMLLRIDFAALGEVGRHWRGIGVTLFINWAVKPFSIRLTRLTARQKNAMKDLARISISKEEKHYGISSYLIAQLAKNYALEDGKLISGRDLVGFILDQIRGIRDQVGGKVVFLEYEKDRPKLRDFYKSCAFEEFKMPSDADDGASFGQMFCFLND